MQTKAIIVTTNASDKFTVSRTKRTLNQLGFSDVGWSSSLSDDIRKVKTAALIIRSGTVLTSFKPIPQSATGLPIVAFGRNGQFDDNLLPQCIYIEKKAIKAIGNAPFLLPWDEMILALTSSRPNVRTVQVPSLNHTYDPKLRILQIITSLQLGGAERVTLDLSESLQHRGHKTWIATTNKPSRQTFKLPKNHIDLSLQPKAEHAKCVQTIANTLQVDIIHTHLISAHTCKEIQQFCPGIPLITTMHNMPDAWPSGFLESAPVDTIISCSKLVGKAANAQGIECKTVWNGIDEKPFTPSANAKVQGLEWRKNLGIKADEFVIGIIANPRRQKRLEFIPKIIHALQRTKKKVKCVIVGGGTNQDAKQALSKLEKQITKYKSPVILAGTTTDTKTAIHGFDVFLSVSRYEGLSLSHLEALAAGIPVIATNVGGAKEVQNEMPDKAYYKLLGRNAAASKFAEAIAKAPRPAHVSKLPKAFIRSTMAKRIEQVYNASIANKEISDPTEIWILTNNFSMGGAQSSARRLLTACHKQGVKVRAITVQEIEVTKGTLALQKAGINVHQITSKNRDTDEQVAEILGIAMQHKPKAILFWNLITSYKLLVADAFKTSKTKVIDVSPGEMSFNSLNQYFQNPRRELPYRNTAEYGATLYKGVVKFSGEFERARRLLNCPIEIIRNGVPIANSSKLQGKKLIFGTAARISPDKRIEDLIQSFALAHDRLPEYELLIAGRVENGATEYFNNLKKQAEGLPIRWLGELPNSSKLLNKIHVFAMISEPAGCPNASLEALAAGLPVVATDVGGACEQIINGVNGFITPRRNNKALAEALVKISKSPETRQKFAKNAKTHIIKNFSMDAMCSQYLAICN